MFNLKIHFKYSRKYNKMLIGFQTSSNEKTADFVSPLVPLHWENTPPLMILASDIPTQTQIIRRKVCKSRKNFF